MNLIPLSPPSPIQSLGYMDDGQQIQCVATLEGFTVGHAYAVRQFEFKAQRTIIRQALDGSLRECVLSGADTAYALLADDRRERFFVDRRFHSGEIRLTNGKPFKPHFDLQTLAERFEIPHVPDIAEMNPDMYSWNLAFLSAVEDIVNRNYE